MLTRAHDRPDTGAARAGRDSRSTNRRALGRRSRPAGPAVTRRHGDRHFAALQGERSAITDAIGAYIIRGLPPGTYTVRFQFAGTADVQQTIVVPLGGLAELDVTLQLGAVQETVNVVADSTPPPLATTQVSTNFSADTINALPVGRRPFEIAELAPGVTDNTPNVGQVSIGGAFAFDSLYLIDGVDTNDNLFGTSNALFIEDAIEETQVLTSGISAEYGRFGGGVVNVITKSGGNSFSGSFRSNFSRPSWTSETPFERSRNQQRSEVLAKYYEGTIGGPDRSQPVVVLQRGSLRELGARDARSPRSAAPMPLAPTTSASS